MSELRAWSLARLEELGWRGLEDVVDYVVQLPNATEAKEYLRSFLGVDVETEKFIAEVVDRMGGEGPKEGRSSVNGPAVDAFFESEGGKRKKKKEKGGKRPTGDGVPTAAVEKKPAAGIVSSSDRLMERIREARRKKEIINCLRCGKVHMTVPLDGACSFCRTPLYDMDDGVESAANDLKNIMLNFDRTAAKRTTVIDDDADYFDSSATTWLSNDEKAKMKAQHDEQLKEADRQKRQITFTIDLAGQKLVVDRQKQPPTEQNERTHTAGRSQERDPLASTGAFANPALGEITPQFIRSSLDVSTAETGVYLARSTHRVQREAAVE